MVSAVRRYFDAAAPQYVRDREAQLSYRAQKALVLGMLRGAQGRVLDLGCGPALMEPALLALGFEAWGIDVSPEMVQAGRARVADPKCHLATGDAGALQFASGFFDAVVSMGLLEYVPDYAPVLREVRRVLRPGGIAIFTVPSRVSPYHLAGRAWRGLRGRSASSLSENRCVPWQLDRELGECGLRKLEGRGCNFIFFPLHDKAPRASDALNRRLGWISKTSLGPFVGSQYVVKAATR
jgi:SAM-dependent methyltransferase